VALTVRDGATLDLAGHRLRFGSGSTAVRLEGVGATLRNGIIQGSGSGFGVDVWGTGRHRIRGIRVEGVDEGFQVTSAHNQFFSNDVEAVFRGFTIAGDHNWLVGNREAHADLGYHLRGHWNTMLQNQSREGIQGVQVTGDYNRLLANTFRDARDNGIYVSGEANWLLRNVALGNEIDAVDAHGTCDQNHWLHNTFETVNPACIQGDS
jgi:hypothetical protein